MWKVMGKAQPSTPPIPPLAQASDGGGAEAATTTDEEDNGDDNDDADAPFEQPPAPSPPPPTHTRRRSCSSSTSGASSSGNSGSRSRDQLQRLPTLAVLRLHFTAIHALRARLEPAPLLEAVFHLKESLPALLLALGDGQLKQVAKADVREIPAMLQVSSRTAWCFDALSP